MQLKAGLFLHSTAALDDSFFAGALIYLTEYNASGAMGFVVNRPFGRFLNDLEEFRHSRPFPLCNGGPVDQEHLFFLHHRSDLVKEGVFIAEGVYAGGHFQEALIGINNGSLSAADIKLFVGYCGWDTNELEAEIAEGSWELKEGNNELIFRTAGQA